MASSGFLLVSSRINVKKKSIFREIFLQQKRGSLSSWAEFKAPSQTNDERERERRMTDKQTDCPKQNVFCEKFNKVWLDKTIIN